MLQERDEESGQSCRDFHRIPQSLQLVTLQKYLLGSLPPSESGGRIQKMHFAAYQIAQLIVGNPEQGDF